MERAREPRKTLRVVSPQDGFVTEKLVVEGQMVDAGMKLYRLADLGLVWVQAQVYEQDLDYPTLKRMVRTSIEHAFLPGQSLWQDGRRFVIGHECAADHPNTKSLTPSCQKLLNASEKAREEWKLEQKFAEFEAMY